MRIGAFLIILLLHLSAIAQDCGTETMYQRAISNNPDYQAKREALNQLAFKQQFENITHQVESGAVKIIPVVFHVMHNYGTENISEAQIQSAIQQLNIDFRNLRSDTGNIASAFKPIVADCEIEFRLATKDPSGNCTNGITRTQTSLTYNANDNVKALINWEHTKYLNVWVVANIDLGGGNVAGYAYYPGIGNGYDGIVMLSNYVGTIGTSSLTKSSTLSHEIGHYLNLPHTWGSSNSCGDAGNCATDDGISDTPLTLGNCHVCDTTKFSCGTLDNVQNYMEYSGCRLMFTNGQKSYIQTTLNGIRNNLWSASNLLATGITSPNGQCLPTSDFFPSSYMVCAGTPVVFNDASHNGPITSWNWSFPGAVSGSSTDSNPSVIYNTPGTYPVSLTSSNSAGNNSITKNDIITVMPDTAGVIVNGTYGNGFECGSQPITNWTVNNESGNTWDVVIASYAYSGFESTYINNYTGNPANTYDELVLKFGLDISNLQIPIISFMMAHALRPSYNDKLEVYVSKDCGATWSRRFLKEDILLPTAGTQYNNFIPTGPADWRKEYVNLSHFIGTKNLLVKFRFISGAGNNIYLDDFMIGEYSILGIEEEILKNKLTVYPNPVSGSQSVQIVVETEATQLKVFDVMGREVRDLSASVQNRTASTIELSGLRKGAYLIRMVTEKGSVSKRLIVN